MRILIISGLSGSGKSTAVRALEDEGFFCLDNLPVTLVPTFIDLVENSKDRVRDVALVMDIRGRDFLKGYEKVIHEIGEAGNSVEILFLDATDEVLIQRFSESPPAPSRTGKRIRIGGYPFRAGTACRFTQPRHHHNRYIGT
jgi:RNase adapter protein RapZ